MKILNPNPNSQQSTYNEIKSYQFPLLTYN